MRQPALGAQVKPVALPAQKLDFEAIELPPAYVEIRAPAVDSELLESLKEWDARTEWAATRIQACWRGSVGRDKAQSAGVHVRGCGVSACRGPGERAVEERSGADWRRCAGPGRGCLAPGGKSRV